MAGSRDDRLPVQELIGPFQIGDQCFHLIDFAARLWFRLKSQQIPLLAGIKPVAQMNFTFAFSAPFGRSLAGC